MHALIAPYKRAEGAIHPCASNRRAPYPEDQKQRLTEYVLDPKTGKTLTVTKVRMPALTHVHTHTHTNTHTFHVHT